MAETPHPAHAQHEYTLTAEDALRLHEVRGARVDAENNLLRAERKLRELLEKEAATMREVAEAHGLGMDTSWELEGRTLRPLFAK